MTVLEYLHEQRLVMRYLIGEMFELRQLMTLVVRKENYIMASLDELTQQVQNNTDVEASAVVLINGIAAQLAAAANDPVAIAALAAKLKDSSAALAAAVTTNTPAANVARGNPIRPAR